MKAEAWKEQYRKESVLVIQKDTFKSVVGDPVLRVNTGDNTPGVLYYEIVPGDRVTIQVAPKGFGSENMSRVFYAETGRWPGGCQKCYPDGGKGCGTECLSSMVVGVGVGGTFEKCAPDGEKSTLARQGTFRN